MLTEDELNAANRLDAGRIISFSVNPDGTLEPSERAYNITAINDYILLVKANEKASMERGYEMGKREGYHQGFKEASDSIYGEFYFMGDETQIAARVTRKTIELYEYVDGVNKSMQMISYENFIKLGQND